MTLLSLSQRRSLAGYNSMGRRSGLCAGFAAHPAVVDSSLHLGAALAAGTADQTRAPRVPVALGLFLAAQPARCVNTKGSAAACAALEAAAEKPVSHFRILSAAGAPAVQLSHLEVGLGAVCLTA